MKKRQESSLKFSKVSVAKISQLKTKLIYGGTEPVSIPRETALASHCSPLMCY